MASFTIPCPKTIQLNGSQSKISLRSNLKSQAASFPARSSCKSQGVPGVKSTILKVQAQLSEVAKKTTNSDPKSKLEVPSYEGKVSVKDEVPDASAITAFMTQVSDLIKLVDSRDITELQLKQLDCELIIRKKEALPQPPAAAPVYMTQSPSQQMFPPQQPPSPAPALPRPTQSAPALPAPAKSSKSSHPPMKCPMAGTFYRCPAPGEPPFVKVGDKIQKGQVVCIVEAMKLMNEIEADQSGTLVEIIAEDGKPVSVDTPLFVIEP